MFYTYIIFHNIREAVWSYELCLCHSLLFFPLESTSLFRLRVWWPPPQVEVIGVGMSGTLAVSLSSDCHVFPLWSAPNLWAPRSSCWGGEKGAVAVVCHGELYVTQVLLRHILSTTLILFRNISREKSLDTWRKQQLKRKKTKVSHRMNGLHPNRTCKNTGQF